MRYTILISGELHRLILIPLTMFSLTEYQSAKLVLSIVLNYLSYYNQ